ncbi:hypothetical protein [Candidatus Pristimantibacillus sp. PTI5]|uniref:hypothetical protein n=1 Tax=Candidatus Pristimantibacillus sp. PTI5 TaxID=3400422 RepID=UPI003B022D55
MGSILIWSILHCDYINFPLKLIELNGGLKHARHPVNFVQETDLKPMLADLNFAFWSNPLLV